MARLYDKQYTKISTYTIGAISRMYKISTDSIRYYEKKGLIKPKREANGYRVYTQDDIWRMNVIRQLRELDISVDRIHTFFERQSVENTVNLLNDTLKAIASRQNELRNLEKTILDELATIEKVKHLQTSQITIQNLPDRPSYRIEQAYSLDEEMDVLIKQLTNKSALGVHLISSNRTAAILAPFDSDQIYSGALIFDDNGDYTVPAGKYLSLCYTGKSNSCQNAARLTDYARRHSFRLDGPFLDIVWIDIHTTTRLEEHVSEVQVKILD